MKIYNEFKCDAVKNIRSYHLTYQYYCANISKDILKGNRYSGFLL